MGKLQQGEGSAKPDVGLYYNKNNSDSSGIVSVYKVPFADNDEVILDINEDIRKIIVKDIKIIGYGNCNNSNNENAIDKAYHLISDGIYRKDLRSQKDYMYLAQEVLKNIPDGIERAIIAHNVLKWCNVETVFKMSMSEIDGKIIPYAYNVIKLGDSYHIFDSVKPMFDEELREYPIVTDISEKQYQRLVDPNGEIGCEICVHHEDKIPDKKYDVIYDVGTEKLKQWQASKGTAYRRVTYESI